MPFRVPSYITVDNGKQFDCVEYRNFCEELNINLAFASVNHPQSNGAVERANAEIFTSLSKMLTEDNKGKWARELTTSVWGHNISKTRAIDFTPFHLLYGEEAITPEEMKFGSLRTVIAATTPAQRYVDIETSEQRKLEAADNLDKYH